MDPKVTFQEVPAAELPTVEGGSWFSKAFNWAKEHLGFSGKDMAGNSAGVVSVKGTWSGNP
jgi:hypothetical protein